MTRDRRRLALRILLSAAAAGGLGGCGGGAGSPPTAPPPPPVPAPPPPPAASVSFVESGLEAREGESVVIEIRYEVRDLPAPWMLRLEAAPDSASETDYELPADTVEIPAGQGISGTASLALAVVEDAFFNEGREALTLRFVPDAAPNAEFGEPLPVGITDSGVSPCAGVRVRGLPWREEEGSSFSSLPMLATTLELELREEGRGTGFELLRPYVNLYADGRVPRSQSTFGIRRWDVRSDGRSVFHELDINWPGEDWFEEETGLDFRFVGGACSGEPVASCSSEGCELIPAP